jgi:hypothetical protein
MITMSDFIEQHGITFSFQWREDVIETITPDYGRPFPVRYDHYDVTVTCEGDTVTFDYSQGEGVQDQPDERTAEVLANFLKDAKAYYEACGSQHLRFNPTVFDFVSFVEELGDTKNLRRSAEQFEGCRQNYGKAVALLSTQILSYAFDQVEL